MNTYRIVRNHLIHGSMEWDSGLTLGEADTRVNSLNENEEEDSLVHYFYEEETSIPATVMGI